MDLKFEKHDKDGVHRDVVILSPSDEVKHARLSNKSHVTAQPYKRKYKNHKSAVKKFLNIVEKITYDEG